MKRPETRNSKPETGYSTIRDPQSELERRARALARLLTEEESEGETLHLVTFSVGEERYGVEITLVQEIVSLESQTWSLVPCTPDFIVGAVSIRGRIYSMMDIGRFLGLPARPLSETAHVFLVRYDGHEGGRGMELSILADDRPQVARVPLTEVQPPSATISSQAQKYVRGVTADMLIILDLEHLLSEPGIRVHEEA
jgi:purine-binding chemotaxis protein CheW